jgi:hypothetical protein
LFHVRRSAIENDGIRGKPEADAQIREIENWWRRNRTASPDLFTNELAATFDILGPFS